MLFEWDEDKREANFAKHGVDFMAAEDFEWDTAIETVDDRFDYGEERWAAMGFIGNRLYVLVYTCRSDRIRIISMRKANKRERAFYETQT